jgi:predicted porin
MHMKGKMLSLAVAAALAAPMASAAEIYGRMQAGLEYLDAGAGADTWDVGSGGHVRWGIVGSEDLGNGMKGLYQYEWGNAADTTGDGSTFDGETTRLAYIGLSGDFGKITLGRNWMPAFFRLGPPASWVQAGRWTSGAYGGIWGPRGFRAGNLMTYDLPNMGAFSAGLALNISNENAAEEGVDFWTVAASYKEGPLFIGGAYQDESYVGGDTDRWGLAANFSMDMFKLRGAYYANDIDGVGDNNGWLVGVEGKFDNNTVYAFYEDWETGGGAVDNDQIRLLFHHHMSKTFTLYAEYNHFETDATPDRDSFEVGMLQFWKL